ncbi:MAG: hypothetical protein AAGI89_02090 [Pseudomonadota bacterium]
MDSILFFISTASQLQIMAAAFAVVVFGAVIAACTHRSQMRMQRVPYFLTMSAISFGVSVSQLVWLNSQSILGMKLAVTVSIAALTVAGYLYYSSSMNRSRDMVESWKMAPLVFVPFGVFYLMTEPPKDEDHRLRGPKRDLFNKDLAVFTAVLLWFAGPIVDFGSGLYQEKSAQNQSPDTATYFADLSIERAGLTRTLEMMTEGVVLPFVVDEVTSIVALDVSGNELKRVYSVDMMDLEFGDLFLESVSRGICVNGTLRAFIDNGATITEVWLDPVSSEIDRLHVTKSTCDQLGL